MHNVAECSLKKSAREETNSTLQQVHLADARMKMNFTVWHNF